MQFRMLDAFRALFDGHIYRHRSSGQGDLISRELYEDLYNIRRSSKFNSSVDRLQRGLNIGNIRQGISARRGDGTLGELVPGQPVTQVSGSAIARGRVATLDIGVEVKILNKAMIKQINDRIAGLQSQAEYFAKGRDGRRRGNPIAAAIIGLNCAEYTIGYEGDRSYRTDGSGNQPHPNQEVDEVERRLTAEVRPSFDEMVVLRYKATNEAPFAFAWANENEARATYGASLVRIALEFEKRF